MQAPRAVSYQQARALGPNRGATPRSHGGFHPYPQTNRVSPVKSAQIRMYGAAAVNSNHQATLTKKAARARRESFKPRPSVEPGLGDDWATSSDTRYAGLLGGSVREEDED